MNIAKEGRVFKFHGAAQVRINEDNKTKNVFSFEDVEIPFDKNQTILDALLEAQQSIDHSCGGNGTCGTCRIIVQEGLEKLTPRNELEQEMAEDRGFEDYERLACQNQAIAGLKVRVKVS